MKKHMFITPLLFAASMAHANLNVVTTVPDLAAIAREVGGPSVNVESIAKGTQDPHYIEAKPSYMVKLGHADLVISIGLDLEIGWLPSILRGSRNPKIIGGKGNMEVGPLVDVLEKVSGNVSRAEGDVHPFGNPHVTLDPIRDTQIALKIAERMGELDPSHAADFQANAKKYEARLTEKTKAWQERIKKSGVKKVVTYHKTLTYFLDRFGIENPAILEPKPGIPPTSGHILDVTKIIRDQKIPLIMVENFFDPSPVKKISADIPTIRSAIVPVSVDGAAGIKTQDDLFEALVKAVEGK